jgi:hypothetical protein
MFFHLLPTNKLIIKLLAEQNLHFISSVKLSLFLQASQRNKGLVCKVQMKLMKPNKCFTKRTFRIKLTGPFHRTEVMEDNLLLNKLDKTI